MSARTFEGRIPLHGGAMSIGLQISGSPAGHSYWCITVSSPGLGERQTWVDAHPDVIEWRSHCIYEALAALGLDPKVIHVEGRWTQ